MKSESFWPCIDNNATDAFKTQKGSKDIVEIVHVLYSHEGNTEEKKLLNKVIIFFLFAHKKFSCSFITFQLNHWYHRDYFIDIFTTFLAL